MADDRKHDEDERERPELSATEVRDRLWSKPGGDEDALRESKSAPEGDSDDHGDAVAKETAETTKHLSDAHIGKPKTGPSNS